MSAARVKLRRQFGKNLETHGRWETADGRFLIERDMFAEPDGWRIRPGLAGRGLTDSQAMVFLQRHGLQGGQTYFPTRREAVDALSLALELEKNSGA